MPEHTPTPRPELALVLAGLPGIGERGDEFRYASLPLCILDAVYSLGANYASVENLIGRYCRRYDLPRLRPRFDQLPPREEQATVADLIGQIELVGPRRFAAEVLQNLRPTSPGPRRVLRSEAVLGISHALDERGVSVLQDMAHMHADVDLYRALCAVPGQSQGTAIRYLFMLAGATDVVKPDRMVLRFLTDGLGRPVGAAEAQRILSDAAAELRRDQPWITAGHLDYAIWAHQRSK